MSLHDKLYLRFGLYHKRYGHMIAYMIEFVIVWVVGMIALTCIWGAVKFTVSVYRDYTESQKRVAQAVQQKVAAEEMLLDCMNGKLVGRTERGEYIGCQGATSFRM